MNQNNSAARSVFLAGIGVLILGVGVYFQMNSGSVSMADRQRCEQSIQKIYGSSEAAKTTLVPKCTEPGMVAMMDAKANGASATDAAQSISSANQSDIGFNAIGFGLLGFGIALTVAGVAGAIRVRRSG